MRWGIVLPLVVCLAVASAACSADEQTPTRRREQGQVTSGGVPDGWGDRANWVRPARSLEPTAADFVDDVTNPYWQLQPGTTWVYEASTDEGTETIEVVVLPEKREVMGVQCTVVRDTVKLEGQLIEDTRDWYAQDTAGNVWYMGEEVDNYANGTLADHEGSWEAGVDGAEPGIKVWATPMVGSAPYYQEYYPGEAEDLGKDVSMRGTASVPFAAYEDLLVVEEWTPLEPDVVERKYYAWGIGTVREEMVRGGDEVVVLTRFERP